MVACLTGGFGPAAPAADAAMSGSASARRRRAGRALMRLTIAAECDGSELRRPPPGALRITAPRDTCPPHAWIGPGTRCFGSLPHDRLHRRAGVPSEIPKRLDMATTHSTSSVDIATLRHAVRGSVLAPGDDGWDEARTPWNVQFQQNPVLVVVPANSADVQAVVRFATANGLRVAPQGTGHGVGSL